jgi:hypothetical protein
MQRIAPILLACAVVLAGCNTDSPLPMDHLEHQHGLSLSSLSQSTSAQTLNALRQLTAPFHDVDAAKAAGYALFTATPLTAADGCISSTTDGGMGYHYTRGNNLGDDSVSLLDPEFLVYAPKNPRERTAKRGRGSPRSTTFSRTAQSGLARMIRASSGHPHCTTSRR